MLELSSLINVERARLGIRRLVFTTSLYLGLMLKYIYFNIS